jgi:hypothetical protein
MLLRTTRMRQVAVDPAARTARAEAACLADASTGAQLTGPLRARPGTGHLRDDPCPALGQLNLDPPQPVPSRGDRRRTTPDPAPRPPGQPARRETATQPIPAPPSWLCAVVAALAMSARGLVTQVV